jgi:chorismate dehydratase
MTPRIGCVSYLNSRPLVFGLEDQVEFAVPSVLAKQLREGKLDVALVPVAEYLENPRYQIIPGIGIGCCGSVRSVYLAHRKPISELKTVALDPASKTSNLLVQVILKEFFQVMPSFVTAGDSIESQLAIGDDALLKLDKFIQDGWEILDLGEIWKKKTGLPFVFAFWAVRDGVNALPYIELLTRAKADGLKNFEKIITTEKIVPHNIAREYLSRNICYDLGADEVKGLREFQRLCVRHGLIQKTSELRLAASQVML